MRRESTPQRGTLAGRFEIVAEIGSGGMGVVFRARDLERGGHVAVKLLRTVDAPGIHRFKREFRALADLVHPNLVPLYELVATDDQWFITMELINGVDFLRHVRGEGGVAREEDLVRTLTIAEETHELLHDSASEEADRATATRVSRGNGAPLQRPDQLVRLRSALTQLVAGIRALHQSGHLHRDIKPSNVLVAADGRLVVLDVGVATALESEKRVGRTMQIVGTPAYMAPEHLAGIPLTAQSDLYAVGVMLYEALAGTRPFCGALEDVVVLKQAVDPEPVSVHAPGAPPELAALCMELLSRDPRRRPDTDEILRRLQEGTTSDRVSTTGPSPNLLPGAVFVGRERELSRLRRAFEGVREGRPVTVCVRGTSGMGKSALIQHFTGEMEATERATVLRGRCYERESVPHKALDTLVDSLAEHLSSLARDEVWSMIPEHVGPLARLFPSLRRVRAIAPRLDRGLDTADPHVQRRRAVSALRSFLSSLSRRRRLILSIDDLQWGDTDSAMLLADLMRPPEAPAVLLVASYRAEDAESSPFLRAFLPPPSDAVELSVPPLSPDRARELCEALLPGSPHAGAIARESGGSPFFVNELVHYVGAAGTGGSFGGISGPDALAGELQLEQVVRSRLAQLPGDARKLLEFIAVCGLPIEQSTAHLAAQLRDDSPRAILHLRAAKLVRTGGSRETDPVETYHDRIRETVVADLDGESLRAIHKRLADALEGSPRADPEAVAVHCAGAGENERASRYFELAAEKATRTLAFNRAAALYSRALELHPRAGSSGAVLRRCLGDALSHAGRGAEAAAVYLDAAGDASAPDALTLRRRAAEELMHSGHIDEGSAVVQEVLEEVGISVPPSPRRAVWSLLWRRALLALRGTRFRIRDASEVGTTDLQLLEVCWSASIGFAMFDVVRGAVFQVRHLLRALRVGEPHQVARALACEACYLSAENGRRRMRRARRIQQRAQALVAGTDDPFILSWVGAGSILVAYQAGRWREARERAERVMDILINRCAGVEWELAVIQLYHLWGLFQLGQVGELTRRVPVLLRCAHERGDLYSVANLSTGVANFAWLCVDQPDRARAAVHDAMARWTVNGVHLQHFWQVLALGNADLYAGDPDAGLTRVRASWRSLRRGLVFRIRMIHSEACDLRARLYLAAATGARKPDYLRAAQRDARTLDGCGILGFDGIALSLRGSVAAARGDSDTARDLLRDAIARLDDSGMALRAAAARRRLGQLVGGDEGAALMAVADAFFAEQEIARPERVAAMFVP